MQKVMIFNPANLEQREVSESDADKAEKEYGWVRVGGANELVAVYHPGQNLHATILKRDLPVWASKGYYAEPTIVYHPEEGSRMVSAEQAKAMLNDGWYDSPAKYSKAAKEAIVDNAVMALHGAQGTTVITPGVSANDSRTPGTGNDADTSKEALEKMTKAEIAQLYFDKFNLTLDSEQKKEQMIAAFAEAAAKAAA